MFLGSCTFRQMLTFFEDSHSRPQRPKRCQPARECHILRRSCARRASSWPAFSVMRVLRFVLSRSASAVTLGAGTSAFLRDEVMCSKVLFKRVVEDGLYIRGQDAARCLVLFFSTAYGADWPLQRYANEAIQSECRRRQVLRHCRHDISVVPSEGHWKCRLLATEHTKQRNWEPHPQHRQPCAACAHKKALRDPLVR